MKELQKMTSKKLLVILPFVLTLVLFANVNWVQAQNWDYITLFQSQSAQIRVTQANPIGSHFVFVTTIGNRSLGAGIGSITAGTQGFWLILVLGTGTTQPADLAGGFIPWNSGQRAIIDLQRATNFNIGLVVTTLILTGVPEDVDAVGYNVTIGQ